MSEQHEQGPDAAPVEIRREQALEQKPVPFWGDELAAAMTAGGNIYIALPAMCRALGLGTQAQLQRILRTPTLAKGLREIPLETRGGVQDTNCLRVDKVALWVAGIEPTRVKAQFRAKIEAYQEELVQLQQAISMLESLAERQDATEAQLAEASAQLAQVDARTQRLTPAHTRDVQTLVDRMVRETKHLPLPLTYAIIYGRLKNRFRVGSYKEVADARFDELLGFLGDMLSQATSGQAPEQGSLFE